MVMRELARGDCAECLRSWCSEVRLLGSCQGGECVRRCVKCWLSESSHAGSAHLARCARLPRRPSRLRTVRRQACLRVRRCVETLQRLADVGHALPVLSPAAFNRPDSIAARSRVSRSPRSMPYLRPSSFQRSTLCRACHSSTVSTPSIRWALHDQLRTRTQVRRSPRRGPEVTLKSGQPASTLPNLRIGRRLPQSRQATRDAVRLCSTRPRIEVVSASSQ
jgi:hypothetical protein